MTDSQNQDSAGWITPYDTNSHYNTHHFWTRQHLSKLRTNVMVKVVAVNAGAHPYSYTVDVQPMVNQVDGDGNSQPHGIVYGIPMFAASGGNGAAVVKPKVGDMGLMAIQDRDTSAAIAANGQANPGSGRMHSMSDGIYLGGFGNLNSTQSYAVQDENGVTVNSNSQVNIASQQATTITAQNAPVSITASHGVNITGNTDITGNVSVTGTISGTGSIPSALLGISQAQIPSNNLSAFNRFLTTDGVPWIQGTSSGPRAVQDSSGTWFVADVVTKGVCALDFIDPTLWASIEAATITTDVTTAVQNAINTGRSVWFPAGKYPVTTLTHNSTGQELHGDGIGSGGGTVLVMSPGTADALTVGNSSTYKSGMRLRDLQLDLSAATGGNAIKAQKVKYFEAINVVVVNPQSAVLLSSGNTLTLDRVNILNVATGATNYAIRAVGTDADPINVLNIYRSTCSPVSTGASGRAMAIIVDGAVDTTDILGFGATRMGRGLWVVNTGGTTNLPNFIQAHSFQADFPEYEGIRIEVGSGFFFQNSYLHGSQNADGAYTASGVGDFSWGTGECTGHAHNGFSLNGTGSVVCSATIARNSASASNTYDGIAFGPTAVGGIVAGNQIGEYNGTTGLQRFGVSVDPSATNIGLGPNNYNGNVSGPFTGLGTPTATMARYACAGMFTEYVLAASAVSASHTGDTNETTLATITLPANAMGANGYVIIESMWTFTNSGNNKVLRGKFGGTQIMGATLTANAFNRHSVIVQNRNATNSQCANALVNTTGGWGAATGALITPAIDTTASVSITLTGQLANSGETVTLESYVVRVLYQP